MTVMNLLGMTQIRPLILAVIDHFPPAEVDKFMKHAVDWSVRLKVSGGLGTGTLESQYSQRAKEVRDGAITSASELRQLIRKDVPTDSVFRAGFEVESVSKAAEARYYLRVLDEIASGNTNPPLVISQNVQAVNLEHVLPQSPVGQWGGIDEDAAKAHFNRLGNLALLSTKLNTAIANAEFEIKATEYATSPFALTREIAEQSQWGIQQIERRQKRLARLAVAAWPR
jgi:hypothetical protein